MSLSSMDALAKAISPARIEMHHKRIQRMLQQNSLLWWELVRYTRNLERREREQEREQEHERSSANQLALAAKAKTLHHYHHHYHHHDPSLPPLHPQQHQHKQRVRQEKRLELERLRDREWERERQDQGYQQQQRLMKNSNSSRSQSRPHPYEYSSAANINNSATTDSNGTKPSSMDGLQPSPLASGGLDSSRPSTPGSSPRSREPSQQHQQQVSHSLPRPVPVKPLSFANSSSTATGPHPERQSGIDPGFVHESTAALSNNAHSAANTHAGAAGSTTTVAATSNSNAHSDTDNPTSTSNLNNSGLDPNRKRRGNLPKSVTSVLKSWLVQNAIHPYPTEDEKMRLSEATQLSMNQISNWFINARRRILQPILVEAAAAAVAGTDAPMENVLIVRKGKGSRMQVEMEGVTPTSALTTSAATTTTANATLGSDSGSMNGAGATSDAQPSRAGSHHQAWAPHGQNQP
ncbi:hypothetical protein BGZ98_006784 [Dissophora globulifera]|nr:hypothetical protein BGZ98_006784 [Dissophora globulifera]